MEEVGTGQEHGASGLSMAGCTRFCREARAAQCSQADGAVPDISLDNLLETNKISPLTNLSLFVPPVPDVYCGRCKDNRIDRCMQKLPLTGLIRREVITCLSVILIKTKQHMHSSAND